MLFLKSMHAVFHIYIYQQIPAITTVHNPAPYNTSPVSIPSPSPHTPPPYIPTTHYHPHCNGLHDFPHLHLCVFVLHIPKPPVDLQHSATDFVHLNSLPHLQSRSSSSARSTSPVEIPVTWEGNRASMALETEGAGMVVQETAVRRRVRIVNCILSVVGFCSGFWMLWTSRMIVVDAAVEGVGEGFIYPFSLRSQASQMHSRPISNLRLDVTLSRLMMP